jgi:hypothetical protein
VSRSRPLHRVRRQGAEPNAARRVWDEGETGAFKCLTLSTLGPAPNAGPFFVGPLGFGSRAAFVYH